MPKNKKKFIPKENALVFHLVHRSQQDPLAVDENAPQHVLKESTSNRKREERKYGIFFDDEYDYLQHLKAVDEYSTNLEQVHYGRCKNTSNSSKAKVFLPSSVFPSDFEESVGILNKAAPIYGPRPELDPDIVAAMDDDFDYDNPDNILEENFVELANKENLNLSEEDDGNTEDFLDEFENESSLMETKSKFTNYSMTSSVIRRNEQLILLDNQFEKVFENYDDNDIGCLAHENIEGTIPPDKFDSLCFDINDKNKDKLENSALLKSLTLQAAENQLLEKEETEVLDVSDEDTEQWDCETIISTYSNIYNHPAKITELKCQRIELSKKTGLPIDLSAPFKLTAQTLATLNGSKPLTPTKSVISQFSELSIRPKNETSEERKARKKNIKEFRRERRMEKKANALAFKTEKCKQEKILLNLKKEQVKIKLF